MRIRPVFLHWVKACAVAFGLAFAFSASTAFAASTDIADVPLAVKNSAYPNVMFTLDDSGSMHFEVIPESDNVYLTFPRPNSSGSKGTALYGTTYYNYGTFDFTPTFDIANKYARCYRNSACNRLYYDPAKKYVPWSNADGTLMANASPDAAWFNPYNAGEGTFPLTSNQTYTRRWVADNGTNSSYALTFYPATYFSYTGSGSAPTVVGDANNIAGNYTKVEIKSGSTYLKAPARTDCAGSECTYTEEIQNFANWFSYYRSRILMARAGVGRAFARQGESMRVGFGAINKGSTSIDGVSTRTVSKGVRAFSGSDRTAFFDVLYSHTMPTSGTPLRRAVDGVGQYFMRTDNNGPWGQTPGTDTGTQFTCRQNYNILMTDGYWSEGSDYDADTAGAKLNVDGTNGTAKTSPLPAPGGSTFTYTAGNPFSDTYSDTLADAAMYYWVNDLRTDMSNIVPTNNRDPAFWQHMVNFTVGLGVYGSIAKSTIDSAFTAISASPPTTAPTITWEDPTSTNAKKIDDLAHAALNSRGNFFSASDPDEFATALSDALDDIVSRDGAAAAVAVANADVTVDNTSYASEYNSGNWSGDLGSYPIDVSTGVPSATATWKAKALLDDPAVTPATRKIVTYSGISGSAQGVQFQPVTATTTTKLSTTQQNSLNSTTTPPGPSDGADVLAFLRGDRSKESTAYRVRASRLGDIVNVEPVVIGTPVFSYGDSGYAAFKAAQSTKAIPDVFTPTRIKTVFQGANDGMVHAFNANDGQESWAYIPSFLFDGSSKLRDLSKLVNFSHKFYIDATPVTGDIDFSNTCPDAGCPLPTPLPTADWRTLLVGGLGKGGRGYYALDVTTPTASSEADAASKVMWEFPNSATTGNVGVTTTSGTTIAGPDAGLAMSANKIGFTNGSPVITKTRAHGWVALVASGYNNGSDTGGDGHGYLFVLNARTGVVLHVFDTGVGSSATPSGLAHISAYVENPQTDNTVQYVYGGDLEGNVWRFDLNDANTSNWKLKRLAALVDAQTTPVKQPVTTAPELAKIYVYGAEKRFVYVGTGRYLGDTDIPGATGANVHATQTQTMYGLVDDLSNPSGATPVISPLRSNLGQQTFGTPADGKREASKTVVNLASKKGWYIDLPLTGERSVTNPILAVGALIFTTNIPSSDVCTPGGSSWLNILDYQNGGQVVGLDYASKFLGDVLASRPILIQLGDGTIKVLIRTSKSETLSAEGPPSGALSNTRRVAWKEIVDE